MENDTRKKQSGNPLITSNVEKTRTPSDTAYVNQTPNRSFIDDRVLQRSSRLRMNVSSIRNFKSNVILLLLLWTTSTSTAESLDLTTENTSTSDLIESNASDSLVTTPYPGELLTANDSLWNSTEMVELTQLNSSSSSLSQSQDPGRNGSRSSKPKPSVGTLGTHRMNHGKPTWKRPRREIEVERKESQNETLIRRDRKSKLIANSNSMVIGPSGSGTSNHQRLRFGEHCECWNSSDGSNREVECSCTHLTANVSLAKDVHRITVENSATFTTLSNEHIRPFADSLLEIILSELPEFSQIDDGAFIGMPNLNTIYIVGAPSLTNISHGVFKGFFPKLKNIKIVHTGLEVTPMLNKLATRNHLDSLDLENNKISYIEPKWVEKLKVEHLTLSYNNLRSIGPGAFEGSTIARLTLEGNRELRELHSHAFVGIESLRQLDLSKTSITILPTHGLKTLEILRVQRTPSLTVIPSIYHFESLKEAAMTYPYHCCAFDYPETHDPAEYKKFREFVEKVQQDNCGKGTTPMTMTLNGKGNELLPGSSSTPTESESFILPIGNEMIPLPRSKRQGQSPLRHRRQLFTSSITGNVEDRPISIYRRRAGREVGPSPVETDSNGSWGSRGDERDYEDHDKPSWVTPGTSSLSAFASALSADYDSTNSNSTNPFSLHSESSSGKSSYDFHDPYYTFDPDRTFTPLDNNQDNNKQGSSWESGHHDKTDGLADDEFGSFHHGSVALPPSVIQLCGSVAVKRISIVKCTPEPDAFSPCEDIMGNMWLRTAVWFVVTLALVGNAAVLIVIILTPGRMSVQRFLMANLSLADLSMGIYLLMVAVEDLVSLGAYFNFAIDWQLGWGCQLAGFLTVFASELSVFTLAVITGERWYALTRAIHLTKRLTIKGAAKLMAVGWFLAINLALMPLIGVSSYSKTSICLPMEASTPVAQAYLAFMLLFNGIAFTMVAYAYYQMYQTVAGHAGGAPAQHSADLAIAKKMGLLVFTDFVCWAPVAFFGLTAVAGHPLIGVTDAKILLVFFYPLNSFCNPYLYAILTKQYRRDLFLLLHRHGMCADTMARFRIGTGAGASTNNTVPTMQTLMRLGSVTDGPRMGGRGSVTASVHLADHIRPNYTNQVSNISTNTSLNGYKQNSSGDPPLQNNSVSPGYMGNKHLDIQNRSPLVSRAGLDSDKTMSGQVSTKNQTGAVHPHNDRSDNGRKDKNSLQFSLESTIDDGESDFDERIQAETSFITLPSKSKASGSSNSAGSTGSSRHRNESRISTLPPIQDSIDDHEISEITPFYTDREH